MLTIYTRSVESPASSGKTLIEVWSAEGPIRAYRMEELSFAWDPHNAAFSQYCEDEKYRGTFTCGPYAPNGSPVGRVYVEIPFRYGEVDWSVVQIVTPRKITTGED